MGITVNTSPQQITASVGETKIDVSVSGGIGPPGPAGEVGGGYTLPVATASVLGGVKIGSGISIDGNGVISASSGYTLPTATSSVLGGVKIGSGVTITDGVISVSTNYAAASHTHAISDVTDLASTLSGIDTAISGKAAASHTHDSLTGQNSSLLCDDNIIVIYADGIYLNGGPIYPYQLGSTAGLILKTGTSGVFETLAQGTAGQVLTVNSGATAPEWKTLAAADIGAAASSHAHSAADITSGTLDIARIPVGTSSTTVAAGNDSRLSDARTPTAHNHAASDINSGVLATARLASSGTASATTFLRGDQTWATAGSSSASDLTSGTLAYARMADPTVTSPSQITASQNDYASFARGINRFTTNAARDLTGMVAGADGEVRVLCNVGTTAANTLTIKDQSSSSTAANRFAVPWAGDCVIPNGASVVCYYDGTTSRWRVIA